MEGNIIQYLSNLFTKIVFKNKSGKEVRAETSDYFDELEIIANDDYITFAADTTGTEPVKGVKIGLDVGKLETVSGIKMYCYDKGDGHIEFSYTAPQPSQPEPEEE